MAKASVSQKASQFLSQLGTAGGPVGAMTAPGLVTFGAGNLQEQVLSGLSDNYAFQRGSAANPAVGSPDSAAAAMSPNLAANYLNLSLPGSPLPMNGLMGSHNLRAAQVTQDRIVAMDQQMYMQMLPQRGVLPVSPMQAAVGAAKQLQSKTSKQRRGGR